MSKRVSFAVSEDEYNRGKKIPRDVNVSEVMREAFQQLLKKYGV